MESNLIKESFKCVRVKFYLYHKKVSLKKSYFKKVSRLTVNYVKHKMSKIILNFINRMF